MLILKDIANMGRARVHRVFHPRGDIILVIGEDNGNVQRFRVASTQLKIASPVFKALLERSFKEGTELQSSSVSRGFEIELPDDDAGGLQLAFTIIWMKDLNKATITSVKAHFSSDSTLLIRTAAMADKYCMWDPIRQFWEHKVWSEDKIAMDSVWQDIKVACLLKSEYVFRRSTSYVLYNHAGPFMAAIDESHGREWAKMMAETFTKTKKKEVQFIKSALLFPGKHDPKAQSTSNPGQASGPGDHPGLPAGTPGHLAQAYWNSYAKMTSSSTTCIDGCLGCKWIERLTHVRTYADYARTDMEVRKIGGDFDDKSLFELMKELNEKPVPIDSSKWYDLSERPLVLQSRKDGRQHQNCKQSRYRVLSRYRDLLASRIEDFESFPEDHHVHEGLCMHCVFSSMPDLGLSND